MRQCKWRELGWHVLPLCYPKEGFMGESKDCIWILSFLDYNVSEFSPVSIGESYSTLHIYNSKWKNVDLYSCLHKLYFENRTYQTRDPVRNLANNPIGNKKQLQVLNISVTEKIILSSIILISHSISKWLSYRWQVQKYQYNEYR